MSGCGGERQCSQGGVPSSSGQQEAAFLFSLALQEVVDEELLRKVSFVLVFLTAGVVQGREKGESQSVGAYGSV